MSTTTCGPSPSPALSVEFPAGFEPAELDAGLLSAALPYFAAWGLDHPSLDRVLEDLGVSRVRAAEAEAAILEQLPTVLPSREARLSALTREAMDYLMDHPGAAEVSPRRRYYSRPYRRFVLELRERYDEIPLAEFADTLRIPQRTLAGWLRRARHG